MMKQNKNIYLVFVMILLVSFSVNAITDVNTIHYYNFETNTSLVDSLNQANGVVANTLLTTGTNGNGFLTNTGSSINATSFNYSNVGSLSFWFNQSSSGNQQLIDDDSTESINIQIFSNSIYAQIDGGSFAISGGFTLDVWNNVILRWNETRYELYLNGVYQNEISQSKTPTDSIKQLFIGQTKDSNARFEGIIDELAIFNKYLNTTEILELQNKSLTYPYVPIPLVQYNISSLAYNISKSCIDGACRYTNINKTSDGLIKTYGYVYTGDYYEPVFLEYFFRVNNQSNNTLITNFYTQDGIDEFGVHQNSYSVMYMYNYETNTYNEYDLQTINNTNKNIFYNITYPYVSYNNETRFVVTQVNLPYAIQDNIIGMREVYIDDNRLFEINNCPHNIVSNSTGTNFNYSINSDNNITYNLYINNSLLSYYIMTDIGNSNQSVIIPPLQNGLYSYKVIFYDNLTRYTDCTLNVCRPNWVKNNNVCIVNLANITYRDTNNCNTIYDIPQDNNLLEPCNTPPNTDKELWVLLIVIMLYIVLLIMTIIFPLASVGLLIVSIFATIVFLEYMTTAPVIIGLLFPIVAIITGGFSIILRNSNN